MEIFLTVMIKMNSIILLIEYQRYKMLLMGDATKIMNQN